MLIIGLLKGGLAKNWVKIDTKSREMVIVCYIKYSMQELPLNR